VSKTYYELLEVPGTATLDDIKRSFRREIAKYHPDKVQHLGQEFQEIAAVKAAELTQAYQTLSDEALRAEYDELLKSGEPAAATPHAAGPASTPSSTAPRRQEAGATPHAPRPQQSAAPPAPAGSGLTQDRARSSDLIQKASEARFRQALQAEFPAFESPSVPGFQFTCVPKPPFWKLKLPPRVLGRFVPHVNAAAVTESWTQASRTKKDTQRDLVVFVMGPSVAPAGELAAAIQEQMRKPMPAGGKLTLVPVNTHTWAAHVPNDAPPVVKSLLTKLKTS
jgi:curved DNA-binding protein CbpA